YSHAETPSVPLRDSLLLVAALPTRHRTQRRALQIRDAFSPKTPDQWPSRQCLSAMHPLLPGEHQRESVVLSRHWLSAVLLLYKCPTTRLKAVHQRLSRKPREMLADREN